MYKFHNSYFVNFVSFVIWRCLYVLYIQEYEHGSLVHWSLGPLVPRNQRARNQPIRKQPIRNQEPRVVRPRDDILVTEHGGCEHMLVANMWRRMAPSCEHMLVANICVNIQINSYVYIIILYYII